MCADMSTGVWGRRCHRHVDGHCRCPDPAVRIPTSNATCFLVPDVDARGNTVTHGFILVPAAGPYVQQGVCVGTVLSCTEVPIVGDTSEGAYSRGYKRGEREESS